MPAEAESELKRPRPAPLSGDPASTTMTGDVRSRLGESNPRWRAAPKEFAPDGDARLTREDFHGFTVPGCGDCGALLDAAIGVLSH